MPSHYIKATFSLNIFKPRIKSCQCPIYHYINHTSPCHIIHNSCNTHTITNQKIEWLIFYPPPQVSTQSENLMLHYHFMIWISSRNDKYFQYLVLIIERIKPKNILIKMTVTKENVILGTLMYTLVVGL